MIANVWVILETIPFEVSRLGFMVLFSLRNLFTFSESMVTCNLSSQCECVVEMTPEKD